jgi:hypothetical protein
MFSFRRFPLDVIHIIIDLSSQEDQYHWLFVSKNWLKWISSKFKLISYSYDQVVQFAYENRWIDVINSREWNWGLYGACKGGHLSLANLIIIKGANNWNSGLRGACVGGHLELANLMISKGANDWDWALTGACNGDHINLVITMILEGATRCMWCKRSIQYHWKKWY